MRGVVESGWLTAGMRVSENTGQPGIGAWASGKRMALDRSRNCNAEDGQSGFGFIFV